MNDMLPPSDEHIVNLIDGYLHGQLDDAALLELEAALSADPAVAQLFAKHAQQAMAMREWFAAEKSANDFSQPPSHHSFCAILAHLEQAHASGQLSDSQMAARMEALESAVSDDTDADGVDQAAQVWDNAGDPAFAALLRALSPTGEPQLVDLETARKRLEQASVDLQQARKAWTIGFGLAAMLALALSLIAIFSQPSAPAVKPQAYVQVPLPPKPVVIPEDPNPWWMLRDTHDAQWVAGPKIDRPLQGQRLALASGLVRMTMANGSSVLVEGPATWQAEGPDRLRLLAGKLTADVPPSGHGFKVLADNAVIVDHGTAFGVSVAAGEPTLTQVFEGKVSVTPTHQGQVADATIDLTANQASLVSASGLRGKRVEITDKNVFVRQNTYEALRGERGLEAQAKAVEGMWQRQPHLIAAHGFFRPDLSGGVGFLPTYVQQGQVQAMLPNALPGSPVLQGLANGEQALATTASPVTTLFLPLDTTENGRLATMGLLRDDQPTLGKDGTEVWLSWESMLCNASTDGTDMSEVWGGVSLFDRVGTDGRREYVFFGLPSLIDEWGYCVHRRSETNALVKPAPNYPLTDATQRAVVPQKANHWLVHVKHQKGTDIIEVYLNPTSPMDLGQPAAVITDVDLRWDGLRIESMHGDFEWMFAGFRLGTRLESVWND